MGMDVRIKARSIGSASVDLDDLQARFHEVFPVEHAFERDTIKYPDVIWDEYEDVPTLTIRTMHRYYGPGYERGPWPEIKRLGDWLVDALGDGWEVHYGSDYDDRWENGLEPWAEVVAINDPLWAEHGNEPYRAYFRRQA